MYFSLLTQTNDNIPPHTHATHQRMKQEPVVLFHQSSVALRRKKCRISRHANNWILAGCPHWQFNPYGVLEDPRKPFIKAQHQVGFWGIAQQDGWEERGRGFGLIRKGASYMVTLRLLRWQCLLSSAYPCCPRVPTRSWWCTLLGFVCLFLSVAQAGLEFPSLLLLLLGPGCSLPPPDLPVLANISLWELRAAERWQGLMLDSAAPDSPRLCEMELTFTAIQRERGRHSLLK